MKYRTLYFLSFVVFISFIVGFFFFQYRILFVLHGYSLSLLDNQSVESFKAFKNIATSKRVFYGLALAASLCHCFLSSKAISNKDLPVFLSRIGFYLSIVAVVILTIGMILALFAPNRVL